MDMLRSARVDTAWVGSDNPTQVEIRWYKCHEGAKVFPTFHAFGSPVWEPDADSWTEGPGVEKDAVRWVPKDIEPPAGQDYHGELSWYQKGIPQSVLDDPEPWGHEPCPPVKPMHIARVRVGGWLYNTVRSRVAVGFNVTRIGPAMPL